MKLTNKGDGGVIVGVMGIVGYLGWKPWNVWGEGHVG